MSSDGEDECLTTEDRELVCRVLQGARPRATHANCEIEWQDDHDTCDVVFKLSCDVDESEDDKIFYYCNSVRDLQAMTEKGTEDFVITDIHSFEDDLL